MEKSQSTLTHIMESVLISFLLLEINVNKNVGFEFYFNKMDKIMSFSLERK